MLLLIYINVLLRYINSCAYVCWTNIRTCAYVYMDKIYIYMDNICICAWTIYIYVYEIYIRIYIDIIYMNEIYMYIWTKKWIYKNMLTIYCWCIALTLDIFLIKKWIYKNMLTIYCWFIALTWEIFFFVTQMRDPRLERVVSQCFL